MWHCCRALLTRNVGQSVKHFHDMHFKLPPFLPALDRSFRPYKPNPDAIQHICNHWGIAASEAVMIGDSAKDDVSIGHFKFPDGGL